MSNGIRALCAATMIAGCSTPAAPPAETSTRPTSAHSGAGTAKPDASTAAGPCLDGDVEGCTARCDKDDLESCVRLARIYNFGNANTPDDPGRAQTIYDKACQKGSGKACYYLSGAYGIGLGAPKDPAEESKLIAKAVPLLTTACDGTDAESCSILADLHMSGKGVPKDAAKETALRVRATELYVKSCEGGDLGNCAMAGVDLSIANRQEKAVALLQKGCDGGDASSCHHLAGHYAEGVGVPVDEAKAAALRKRACAGGVAAACR